MDPSQIVSILRERMARVEQRIGDACRRAGRPRSDVAVVAVTKKLPLETTRLLPTLGFLQLGENRPQELWEKAASLPKSVGWHLIGHLQRNKIERTLPLVQCIHSVDSVRLLEAIEKEAAKRDRTVDVLLEVNASGEKSKQGFAVAEASDLVPLLDRLVHVRVRGLMTMAPFLADPEECRPVFTAVRKLRDKLRKRLSPGHEFGELSMGMTNDFEVAIEEGATLVRLGTVYFEGLGA